RVRLRCPLPPAPLLEEGAAAQAAKCTVVDKHILLYASNLSKTLLA
ncbi:MAG: hypothetical protein ACI9G6_002580, partial [Limisphaerales bacterium]